jgi:hypothetical protein
MCHDVLFVHETVVQKRVPALFFVEVGGAVASVDRAPHPPTLRLLDIRNWSLQTRILVVSAETG